MSDKSAVRDLEKQKGLLTITSVIVRYNWRCCKHIWILCKGDTVRVTLTKGVTLLNGITLLKTIHIPQVTAAVSYYWWRCHMLQGCWTKKTKKVELRDFSPPVRPLFRSERLIPAWGQLRLLFRSSPLMFHWLKQDMWPNPRLTGQRIKSSHKVREVKMCWATIYKHLQIY